MKKKKKKINNQFFPQQLWILVFMILFAVGCAQKKSPDVNPEHDEFYKYAHYFFTKDERQIYKNLTTDESRERFVKNFWELRDPNPYTDENEFKVELESRYDYAVRYLREGPVPGWKTDRGRIYIILGPPSESREDMLQRGAIIQWYYEEYNVYVRFIDYSGYGVYQMDVNSVSLGILDVLQKRKFFIVNKDGKIVWHKIDFDLHYNGQKKEIILKLDAKKLHYEEKEDDSNKMVAKVKLDLVVYQEKNTDDFFKLSEIKEIEVQKDKLLEKDAVVTATIPAELPPGKLKIDAIVADFLGDTIHRKFIKINN